MNDLMAWDVFDNQANPMKEARIVIDRRVLPHAASARPSQDFWSRLYYRNGNPRKKSTILPQVPLKDQTLDAQ